MNRVRSNQTAGKRGDTHPTSGAAEAEGRATDQALDFIHAIVAKDAAEQKYLQIHTRFPPEPNGYLHIGHAKSICLNFGLALRFGGICNLRLDDTNPVKESTEYVDSIRTDVSWLIAGWADAVLGLKRSSQSPATSDVNGKIDVHCPAIPSVTRSSPDERHAHLEPFYASDYFEHFYAFAQELIKRGKAYVCDLSPKDTDEYRGAPDRPGKNSPYRTRTIEENLSLFAQMRAGDFPDSFRTLRAKIDMAAPNVWMRDPILYRIRHCHHHRTGSAWCIYPMYDFAHCLSDYIEGISHSICTLEFEVHRPLYDWLLTSLDLARPLPRQYEFSRLNLAYTVMSKRKLALLVKERHVSGWDDPRMPTISGMRRRGITASALRRFVQGVGITRINGTVEAAAFAHAVRTELETHSARRLVVLRPLRIILTNFPDDKIEYVYAPNHPRRSEAGMRQLPLARELLIERDDFAEHPEPGYKRLTLGGVIRLKYSHVIRCDELIKDADGALIELRCSIASTQTADRKQPSQRAVAAIHWVSARHAINAEIRLYGELFSIADPDTSDDFRQHLNPHSLEVLEAKCEPSLAALDSNARYQFERLGYFAPDQDFRTDRPVFNRTVTLRESWPRRQTKPGPSTPPEGSSTMRSAAASPSDSNWGKLDEVTVKGRTIRTTGALIDGIPIVCSGRSPTIATIKDEWWQPRQFIEDPERFLALLRSSELRCDLFTFSQRPPNLHPQYGYSIEWDNLAAIPLSSASVWLQQQISADARQNIKKARKAGVVVKLSALDDALVRGIWEIYNETPFRQGKPFYHYGTDLQTVRDRNSTYSNQTVFICAYFDDELIGFLQLNRMGQFADVKQLVSKNAHYDKKPGNALIAKAVEVCIEDGMQHLIYGKYHYYGGAKNDSLLEFKKRHGFQQIPVPRYYIPLSTCGKLALKLGLHRDYRMLLPEPVLRLLLSARNRLYQSRWLNRASANSGGKL